MPISLQRGGGLHEGSGGSGGGSGVYAGVYIRVVCVRCVYVVYTLCICCVYVVYTLCIRCVYVVYTLCIRCVYVVYTLCIRHVCAIWTCVLVPISLHSFCMHASTHFRFLPEARLSWKSRLQRGVSSSHSSRSVDDTWTVKKEEEEEEKVQKKFQHPFFPYVATPFLPFLPYVRALFWQTCRKAAEVRPEGAKR